jgi:hypothetical protein
MTHPGLNLVRWLQLKDIRYLPFPVAFPRRPFDSIVGGTPRCIVQSVYGPVGKTTP